MEELFPQLLNEPGVKDIKHTDIHTAEPLVPESSAFQFQLAIGKLKSHKSFGFDQIPAELINAGGRKIRSQIHKLIISVWNKEELPEKWKELISVLIYKRAIKRIVVFIAAYHFFQLRTKFFPACCIKVNSISSGNYLGSSMWVRTQQVDC